MIGASSSSVQWWLALLAFVVAGCAEHGGALPCPDAEYWAASGGPHAAAWARWECENQARRHGLRW